MELLMCDRAIHYEFRRAWNSLQRDTLWIWCVLIESLTSGAVTGRKDCCGKLVAMLLLERPVSARCAVRSNWCMMLAEVVHLAVIYIGVSLNGRTIRTQSIGHMSQLPEWRYASFTCRYIWTIPFWRTWAMRLPCTSGLESWLCF